VSAGRAQFYLSACRNKEFLVVFDIPLLFENRLDFPDLDHIAVVSASPATQRRRVLAREGMTEPKFEAILSKQLPDVEKRQRADFVITTDLSLGFVETKAQVAHMLEGVIDAHPDKWELWKKRKIVRDNFGVDSPPLHPLHPFLLYFLS
jgi:dephospho-CoA kinase